MNISDFNLIDEMVELKAMDMGHKAQLDRLIKEYIDKGFSMCYTCDPQVRQAFKRLQTWWLLNRDTWEKSIFNKK